MAQFLLIFLITSLVSSEKIRLWTVEQEDSSQLLKTINATFYPDIDIKKRKDITTILTECDRKCNVLYTASIGNNIYPNLLNPISNDDYELIMNKSINIYVEYPSCIHTYLNKCQTFHINNSHTAVYERAVVVSPKLTPLQPFTIIDLHQVTWIDIRDIEPIIEKNNLLMVAKVAGFDYALYEFGGTTTYPLLYESNNMIISLTSLSDYSLARFVPTHHIRVVLTLIINKLMESSLNISQIAWIDHVVQPTFLLDNTTNIKQSFQRGVNWIFDSKLLVEKYIQINSSMDRPTPAPNATIGDGSIGIFEGFTSLINGTGGQNQSIILRTDCQGEITGALGWAGYLLNNEYYHKVAHNLLTWVFETSITQKGERNNPESPAYGLLLWTINNAGGNVTVYGDDNARAILGFLMGITLLDNSTYNVNRFVPHVVRAILGNFRLTSSKGFDIKNINMETLNKNGWEYYWYGEYEFDDPHYESWIWCTYLITYNITQYYPMYERTVIGMEHMMDAYYDGTLHWANGLTQEYSRLLLPLAFLNRIEDMENPRHLKWLIDMGKQLKVYFTNNTIEEHYGNLAYGRARPPQSNAQYGTGEAPLEQENGDPVSDALYTLPFALWGLHEAYLLTNDYELFGSVLDGLIKYLINTQAFVDSEFTQYSYLNGSWFRAYDFVQNEFFASASDIGWGPTSIESGWTVGEILSAFGMIMTNNSFFDIVNGETLHDFEEYVKLYVPIYGLPPFPSNKS